ncbi:MAG: 8-amino-7-oxononanoate synthase [Acidithiobacillales bacterium SG8_45]|jgi:8-amino-7-oxononanoate synthase|nr:MAG: 8-amino-7-oxononanoate synthase [Acidithiobacillales bacterium SG8_45]
MTDLDQKLQALRDENLFRERRLLQSRQGVEITIDNEPLLAFCSNDYLGLAADPRVIAAMQRGAEEYGVGSGASHLVTGHSTPHHALEEELAEFVGAERALVFSTGYMANIGVLSSLMQRGSLIIEDKLNHASLIDAARLARADSRRYLHGDLARVEQLLKEANGHTLIATDAVFSMDGDLAPLPQLLALARQHGGWLLADDAHGLGVIGEHGRGSFSHFGIGLDDPIIYIGTLGKAFGTFGAFVAGSDTLIETLLQTARTYIYTTALPPAVAEATRESLRIVKSEDWRRERLSKLISAFRAGVSEMGLDLMPSDTAIQPIVLGSAEAALAATSKLREQGILVPAIRPPTVPAGSARLRITFSAAHTDEHLETLLSALAELAVAA